MESFPSLDRTAVSSSALTDPRDDLAYWKTRTPEERLRFTELLRRMNYGYGDPPPRLQRVFETVRLTDL